MGTSEADFNATILEIASKKIISIYVSVKNRTNTMGGQDWPKAIRAMETMAQGDKNRTGPYLCVFGIAMDKGSRNIRNEGKTGRPYSFNTEVWLSDYFWPFFLNCSYEEVIKTVLQVLIEKGGTSSLDINIPEELITSFGKECANFGLLDEKGNFNDPEKLVDLFCGKLSKSQK